MKNRIIFLCLVFACHTSLFAQNFDAESPNGRIKVNVQVTDVISWSAALDGNTVIARAEVGMDFSTGKDIGTNPRIKSHSRESVRLIIRPEIPHKDAEIVDEYQKLDLEFKEKFRLSFRVYNDGVAYQFTDDNRGIRNVVSERLSVTFPENSGSLFPEEESMYSHNERVYLEKALPEISEDVFCSLPVLFETDNGKVLLTETALHDYPGMFMQGSGGLTLDAIFPNYVLETIPAEQGPDRNETITKEADYIAKGSGKRSYPWRVFIISDDDRTFVESNLSYQLARPLAIESTDWIKPGKVAWDWYNANNIYGVDFKSGLNTATYKYYIDFASKNGIEYVILDEGWTKSTTEILGFNPDMDVEEIIRYGEEKGVGIILWVLWKPLNDNMIEILETYKSWGAKGIKVDFMQRNDQYMVQSYEEIASECARLELLVDYHGAFKPSGLRRAYPNIVNYEGVKGTENNKWSSDITPEHNVTIPFIRMAAGPMDYTPGSMINASKTNYAISFERPMSQGTRAHQVAMYIVYEAPLQMLCESPSRYYREQETVDFMTRIPTIWDETQVLEGSVGDFIVVARRNGENWYLGGMTDWETRDFDLSLGFIGDGSYRMEVFKDGINADRFAEDYQTEESLVDQNSQIQISMASGGGWSAILTKQ